MNRVLTRAELRPADWVVWPGDFFRDGGVIFGFNWRALFPHAQARDHFSERPEDLRRTA